VTDETNEEAAGDYACKYTTLGERGPVLPIGVTGPDGALQRALEVKPWRMKEERELGRIHEELGGDQAQLASYISAILGYMCPVLGGKKLDGDAARSQVHIGQMYMADVFYAYCYLRWKSMGHGLPFELTSPNTGKKFQWEADLRTVEVGYVEKTEDLYWEYEVQVPFDVRGKEVTKLVMGPQRWNVVEMLGPDSNAGGAKAQVIAASVYSIPECQQGPIALIDTDLDEMTKLDIELITEAIDDHGLGPKMVLEVVDQTVKGQNKPTFKTPIDWRYQSFFRSSSPS
jgi:hypothetical protein